MEKQEIEKRQQVDIQKRQKQIAKAQKYLLSFSGNDTKAYAIKQRIFKLKEEIGDTSPTYVLGYMGGKVEAR